MYEPTTLMVALQVVAWVVVSGLTFFFGYPQFFGSHGGIKNCWKVANSTDLGFWDAFDSKENYEEFDRAAYAGWMIFLYPVVVIGSGGLAYLLVGLLWG